MHDNRAPGALISYSIDENSDLPAYKQLYLGMRQSIISGRLAANTRLPASRVLAAECRISRNTVMAAIDLLQSEGYVTTRVGDGTYVSGSLPEDYFLPREPPGRTGAPAADAFPALSNRGRALTRLSVAAGQTPPGVFAPDLPAFDKFPTMLWGRLMVQGWHEIQPSWLVHADPAGYVPLRQLLSQHLKAARMLNCSADEVIITSGTQQSLDLLSRVLIDQGDPVWLEEPGYLGARSAFLAAGARLVPVPVDEDGINVGLGIGLEEAPRLICVSPSRQYPLGVTMSMDRRRELLAFAENRDAWIVEDDYDSEFRYRGLPLPAMQSMDQAGRVIYLGTFSKTLLPSFRLGYMVVPRRLAAAFANAKAVIDRHPPLLEQITLANFIKSGDFSAHIRRMRKLYESRQAVLIQEVRDQCGESLKVMPADTGMHVVALLPDEIDDLVFCRKALGSGLSLRALSIYYLGPFPKMGLILGFASTAPDRMRSGARTLRAMLSKYSNQA